MSAADLLAVIEIALATSTIVGIGGIGALFILRRGPLLAQLSVLVLASIGSIVLSMVIVAQQMYLSTHDLAAGMAIAGIAGIVALLTATLLGRVVARNSKMLSEAARQLGTSEKISFRGSHSSSEFTALARELAATSARLAHARAHAQRVENSRRELVTWISHDLRTPLAGAKAMVEALQDGLAPNPAEYQKRIRAQIDRLANMVDDLFELARIDAHALQLSPTLVVLSDLVSDTIADLRGYARHREITVIDLARGVVIAADAQLLSRAIGNVFMNAVQHTPDGTPITVAVASDDRHARISVSDQGGGMDEDDLAHVFEPAWRKTDSRTPLSAAPGAGLGLAIVKGIMSAHNGEVHARNIPGGASFDLLLPPHDRLATGRAMS